MLLDEFDALDVHANDDIKRALFRVLSRDSKRVNHECIEVRHELTIRLKTSRGGDIVRHLRRRGDFLTRSNGHTVRTEEVQLGASTSQLNAESVDVQTQRT